MNEIRNSSLKRASKDLAFELENRKQQQLINKLLKGAKTLKQLQIDPIKTQVYLQWMDFKAPSRRRIKTDFGTNQSRMHKIKQIKKQQLKKQAESYEEKDHLAKKYYSQSVQFPKISKNFNYRGDHSQNKKKQISRYRSANNTNLGTIEQDQTQQYTHKNNANNNKYAINLNIDKQTPRPKNIKLNPTHTKATKFRNKKQNKGRQTTFKRQWLEIDILLLDTYFMKIRNKMRQGTQNGPTIQQSVNGIKQESIHQKLGFPVKEKVPEYIRRYKVYNPQIDVDELVKREEFSVVFNNQKQGQQFLYFGGLINQKKQGYGIFVNKSHKFQGRWRNNQKIEGYQITSRGYYSGKFKKNKRHGEGEFYWNNGESYAGQWFNGLKNGSGMWKSGRGDSYIGNWNSGKVQGFGVHISSKGQRYQGQFKNFLKEGKGKQIFPNGDIYEGEYMKGKPHGHGKYIWKMGITFKGDFIDGYRHGKGHIEAPDYLKFHGNFQLDKPNGEGQLVFSNGNTYKGQFKNGKKQGKGIMGLKQQRKIYKGIWKQGQLLQSSNKP